MKYFELLIIVLLSVFIACQEFKSMSGYIFDYDTGKPVKGAIVKFYYDSIIPANGNNNEIAVTDEKGRYKISIKDKKAGDNNKIYIEVKKVGYITLNDIFSPAKDNQLSIYLKEASAKEF